MPGPANYLAEGLWHHNSGKTRAGSQGLAEIILSDPEPEGQFGICAPTYRDAWTVCVEGESGILRALGTTPGEVKHGKSRIVDYAHRSYGEIGLRNGHIIFVDSADDGALRIQGKNLRSIWADELGLWSKWQVAWDESIRYAVRKGASRIIATGTPKISRPARTLMRRLLKGEEPGVVVRRLRTIDNAANLSEAFYQSVIGAAKGTRLERQELEGELLDDVENALWSRDLLESCQVPALDCYLHQAVIGVDPSDGSEESDEQAYTVAGMAAVDDPHVYVVESWGGQESPVKFARRVVLKAVQYDAKIIVEKNHGGAWLTATFDQVIKELDKEGRLPDHRRPRVETVHASQSKRTRAEPVAALYERGVVLHAGGPFVELEDSMCIAGGTLVATAQGEQPIENVAVGDLVWTRAGVRPVLWSGFTGIRRTLTITTGKGVLTCTEDHLIYVAGRGFTRADEVKQGDILITWQGMFQSGQGDPLDRSLISKASATTAKARAITRPAAAAASSPFTALSGRTLTGRSRTGGTFTTRITTPVTTISPISWRFQGPITSGTTGRQTDPGVPWPSLLRSAAGGDARSGRASSLATTCAGSAGNRTGRPPTSRLTTAPPSAATAPWGAVVLSVTGSGAKPVYDLTVSEQPEFFAGGLLVHNCTFTGAAGEKSPDRLDAAVWTLQPWLNRSFGLQLPAGVRKWAGAQDLGDIGLGEEARGHKRIREIAGRGQAAQVTGWDDLDAFSPQDERDLPKRSNVVSWR